MHPGALAQASGALAFRRPSWFHPVLLAGPGLALTAWLPPEARAFAALVAIILLGVPHGALDGELARTALRPRFGHGWFAVFSVPYLLLSALVLLCWHAAPLVTLAAFLAASVWHFGTEETGSSDPLEVIAAGGLPIALAVLVHPQATAAVFAAVSQTPMPRPPAWLWTAALLWLLPAVRRTLRSLLSGQAAGLIVPALLTGLFVLLPPLTAFAIYFVCVHAPAHTLSLIRDARRAPRVRDRGHAVLLAAPVTLLTLLLGAALWPLYPGPADTRLLCLTIQALAALTLPHMLFEHWLRDHPRPARLDSGGKAG